MNISNIDVDIEILCCSLKSSVKGALFYLYYCWNVFTTWDLCIFQSLGVTWWQNLGEVSGIEAPLWYISTWQMAYIFACVLIWQKSMQKILLREGHCGNWSGFLGNAPERTFATLPSAHWMRVGHFNLSCDGCIWFIEGLVMLCSKFRV